MASGGNKKKETCTICIEEIKYVTEARIDSCDHKFCFECIKAWADKCENSCPNCKKKFKVIIVRDVLENDLEIKVEEKINSGNVCDLCDNP